VFTVDFSLAALQKHLATLTPMGAGRVELLSPGRGAGLGQCRRDRQARSDALTRSMLADIAADRRFEAFTPMRPATCAYVPLRGRCPQRFALGVVMPHAVIVAEARQLLWLTLLVGVVAALTLSAGVYVCCCAAWRSARWPKPCAWR
jgi:methyl-accepting chemotaxis protein